MALRQSEGEMPDVTIQASVKALQRSIVGIAEYALSGDVPKGRPIPETADQVKVRNFKLNFGLFGNDEKSKQEMKTIVKLVYELNDCVQSDTYKNASESNRNMLAYTYIEPIIRTTAALESHSDTHRRLTETVEDFKYKQPQVMMAGFDAIRAAKLESVKIKMGTNVENQLENNSNDEYGSHHPSPNKN